MPCLFCVAPDLSYGHLDGSQGAKPAVATPGQPRAVAPRDFSLPERVARSVSSCRARGDAASGIVQRRSAAEPGTGLGGLEAVTCQAMVAEVAARAFPMTTVVPQLLALPRPAALLATRDATADAATPTSTVRKSSQRIELPVVSTMPFYDFDFHLLPCFSVEPHDFSHAFCFLRPPPTPPRHCVM